MTTLSKFFEEEKDIANRWTKKDKNIFLSVLCKRTSSKKFKTFQLFDIKINLIDFDCT